MRKFGRHSRTRLLTLAMLLGALATGCGGGRDPILGDGTVGNGGTPPRVTAVTPLDAAANVATKKTVVNATFDEAIAPLTSAGSITLTCAACAAVSGDLSLDSSGTVITFKPHIALLPMTLYTATVAGARGLASGLAMTAPFQWHFTTGAAAPPTVTAVAPLNGATGVALNATVVSIGFSEAMAPIAGAATFTVTCVSPCTTPAGTLAQDADNTNATFTSATPFEPATTYTATVTGATSLATGLALAAPYQWEFTTGTTLDVTRPQVTLTFPATTTGGPTPGVPANAAITAAFTEDMQPASISGTSFTLTCTAPCTAAPTGAVSYSVGNRTATFTPAAALTVGAVYTATITTLATDLAGNALAGNQGPLPGASNYVWSFTVAAAAAPANVNVSSTNPASAQATVCPNATVNATFTVPSGLRMDPNSVNASTFTVTGSAPAFAPVLASSVVLDAATGHIATFTPQAPLTVGTTYTATIDGGPSGVKDLAVPPNDLAQDFSWSFTVAAATGNCLQPPSLGTAATYGTYGGTAGMTNSGITTVIHGDIGTIATTTSSITGFHDAVDVYTETLGADVGDVTGSINTCTTSTTGPTHPAVNAVACSAAGQALTDAQAAYLELAGLPAGANPGANLAGLTLAPGVYTAPAGSLEMLGGNLTLDAQGNANAVWVFQMSTSLTVGGPAAPGSVILVNGAQAKNVFWQVGSAATINAAGGGTMVGTIIAMSGEVFSTAGNVATVTLNGRALSLNASVTLVDTVINVPAP